MSALYLRYNTGLPIEANARQFAALLGELLQAAPQLGELVLVGHGMGGLLARRALAIATETALEWAARTSMLICLGSPNQGAALAKLGAVASAALMATDVTRPLGRIADARSQGVKDPRKGMSAPSQRRTHPEALRCPCAWSLRPWATMQAGQAASGRASCSAMAWCTREAGRMTR